MRKNINNIFHKYDFFYLILFIIVLCLSLTVLSKMRAEEFLFMHDEYIGPVSGDLGDQLSSLNPTDFGTPFLLHAVITFYDRIWYILSSLIGLNIQITTRVLYIIKLLILTILPYFGFKKLFTQFSEENKDRFLPFAISLWYSFNTYATDNWNTAGFSLTSLISYSLAPLCLNLFFKSLRYKSKITTQWSTVLLLFLLSFNIYLFAVILIIMSIITACVFFFGNKNREFRFANLLKLVALYAPLGTLYVSVLMGTSILMDGGDTTKLGATYSNIGGILHIMRGLYNWASYTPWVPKSIFTYSDYYQSTYVAISSLLLISLLIFGSLKQRKSVLLSALVIFLTSLMLAKGSKPPFGNIYQFLYDNVPGFIIFRTPDSKLGLGVVLATALSLLFVEKSYKKLIILVLVIVTSVQAVPMLTGEALIGRDTKTSYDRKIQIRPEHGEYLDYVNNNYSSFGYILPIPAVNFGKYYLEDADYYIGYDLLPSFSKLPYISLSEYSLANYKTKELLKNYYNTSQITAPIFPIRFFVVRKDLSNNEDVTDMTKMLNEKAKRVFVNNLYTIYESPNYMGLVHADQSEIERISSVKYSIKLRNISQDRVITLLQNYNPGWTMYIEDYPHSTKVDSTLYDAVIDSVKYLVTQPYPTDKHTLGYDYANSWLIETDLIKENYPVSHYKVNTDGTVDIDISIFYKPHAVYVSSILVIIFYISIGTIAVILINKIKAKPETIPLIKTVHN